ncbi:MAG: PAS domain S-box protein [Deltaproteobacteria bacterium]|nr:PAS domain S-box protein [Deltaproteobacteria bacterium]
MMRRRPGKDGSPSPSYSVLPRVFGIVFLCQLVVMVFVPMFFPGVPIVLVSLGGAGLSAPLLWWFVVQDLTKRRPGEKQIRLLTTAVESIANAIVITDRNGSITWINPAFTVLTGYTPAEVLGQNPRILKSGAQDRSFYEELWRTIVAGKVWQGEMLNRRKDGSLYVEEQTITPVRDADGNINSFIAVKQDITERKRTEEMARVRAQEANRLKTQLVSALAHDIKNPLTVIVGYAGTVESRLRHQLENQENLYALQRIEDNASRIVKLITGFLEASKVEAGKLEAVRRPIQLNSLIREVCQQQMGELQKNNLSLRLELDEHLPEISADQEQIDRVLWNLIGNAIKFTPRSGEITVKSRVENAHVRVEVKDTGMGIPKDELPLVFSEFRRLKGSATIEGTGLGLFIVKTIVEGHGGKVGVESDEGKGTTFIASLPISAR